MQRHHPQTMTAETLNRYAVQGVTPPTAEQLKYLAEQEIRLDEMKWGVWPNPAKNPNVLENWRGRMSHRTKAYIMAFGIHKSEATRMMMGYKRTMEAERHFDWAYARELADKEIAVRVHTKGKTVTDDIPGGDIMTKQQPAHVATPGSAHLPISKPIDDETKDRAQALDDAFDRILRQMNYVDTDHNVRRRVFRAYKNASSALQVVMHPDFMQLRAETAFIEAITEVQARKAVTNTETTSELDEAFPRCKIHNIPLEDSGKCRTCELNASMSPDEPIAKKKDPIDLAWFQFYENCKKTWGYEHDFILNEILGVSSAKATGLSPNETMKKVKAYWDAHQIAPEPPVSNGAETIAPANGQGATLNETKPIDPEPTQKSDPPQIASNVPNLNGAEKSETKTPKYTAPLQIQTLTGIPMGMIRQELDRPLPPQAYKEIPFGTMKGKTDIDVERIRDRFDQVFGPQGLGWAIEPIPGDSQVLTGVEIRKAKDSEQTWYVIDLVNYRLRYTVMLPDASLKDCYGTAMSDSGDNMDRGYALEGTMSSLIKQAYRRMGGMNHIYYGVYTHVQAKRDLAAK